MKLKPHLVLRHALAGQARPVDRLFAFLDVLLGGPGTGKSHIATALGVQAIEHDRCKVRFYSTVELVNALEQEKALGKAGKLAERLTKIDLVILERRVRNGAEFVIFGSLVIRLDPLRFERTQSV